MRRKRDAPANVGGRPTTNRERRATANADRRTQIGPEMHAPTNVGARARARVEARARAGGEARAAGALALFVAACAALACLSPAATRASAAHKFHTSFTEANYNAETGALEITLRTFPDDVAAALGRRGGPRVAPGEKRDPKREFEEALFAYVGETFQLKTAKGEAVKLSWVGSDSGVDSAWLYFEARLPDGVEGVSLRNAFLADLYEDQINLVTVRAGERKGSLRFERGGAFQEIKLK